MELTDKQIKTLNIVTGIKQKTLKKYFSYFNHPYDSNKRKEYLFILTKGGDVPTLKKFNFLLNNVKTREAKDIVLVASKKFEEVCPELFETKIENID